MAKNNLSEKKSYYHMLERCYDTSSSGYKNYGARGIKVCERWLDNNRVVVNKSRVRKGLLNFLNDMGNKPSSEYSLDRINNDGDYCPENCRWADKKTQAINRRSTKLLTYMGKTMTASQWAKKLGVNRSTITERIRQYGWSDVDRILSKPYERRLG